MIYWIPGHKPPDEFGYRPSAFDIAVSWIETKVSNWTSRLLSSDPPAQASQNLAQPTQTISTAADSSPTEEMHPPSLY